VLLHSHRLVLKVLITRTGWRLRNCAMSLPEVKTPLLLLPSGLLYLCKDGAVRSKMCRYYRMRSRVSPWRWTTWRSLWRWTTWSETSLIVIPMDSTLSVIRKNSQVRLLFQCPSYHNEGPQLRIEIMGLMFYKVWNLLTLLYYPINQNCPYTVLKLPVDSFQTTVRLCTD